MEGDADVGLVGVLGVEDVQRGQHVADGGGGPVLQGDLREQLAQRFRPDGGEDAGHGQAPPPRVRQVRLPGQ
ncbi:hypothetical protein AB0L05_01600 [Nonomuraea pusilla]|uniref:hypothetical protein n=1 Tax=Nonomuraea pusilla TaxID=46177 RepID=UPI00331C7A55